MAGPGDSIVDSFKKSFRDFEDRATLGPARRYVSKEMDSARSAVNRAEDSLKQTAKGYYQRAKARYQSRRGRR